MVKLRAFYQHANNAPFQAYVNATWISMKERFVGASIDDARHLGITSTSRVEGMHWVAKDYIGTSRGTLETAGRRVLEVMRIIVREIRTMTETQVQSIPLATRNKPIFANVRSLILYCVLCCLFVCTYYSFTK